MFWGDDLDGVFNKKPVIRADRITGVGEALTFRGGNVPPVAPNAPSHILIKSMTF